MTVKKEETFLTCYANDIRITFLLAQCLFSKEIQHAIQNRSNLTRQLYRYVLISSNSKHPTHVHAILTFMSFYTEIWHVLKTPSTVWYYVAVCGV